MPKLIRSVSILILVLLLVACSVNPATGKRQFNMLPASQEIELGRKAAPDFVSKLGGEIDSQEIRDYTSDIGRRLAAHGERPKLPWKFTVVDSQVLNAFALPGGNVFISRGLLEKLEDEAMLAGVLAHEIGHTTAQHIGQQMTQKMILAGVTTAAGAAVDNSDSEWLHVLGVGASVGGGLYLLKFGRGQELEADHLGIRYMTREGYDPSGMIRVLRVLEHAANGAPKSAIFSTHPDPATRVKRARNYVAKHFPDAGDSNRYVVNTVRFKQVVLDNLATLPPPRHGATQEK